ncbi:YcxB family protein [Clostridium sp. 'White wine YQ']|uniref:YcxB family protein n=1 Tax=Clostridium sp. 'White wine YQ' TaxID=3027474 RepID=UPI00236502EE|nr:YcxB family protein [Clostridium sp. 'White wine YQ']MDD7796090.1 YcxB family protein [Clostridium sp. 'White wine YQ']
MKTIEMRYLKSGKNYMVSILLTNESIKAISTYSTVIYNWSSVNKVLENNLYFHIYIGVNGRVFIPKNIQNKQMLIDALKDNIPEHKFTFIKKQRNIFDVFKDIKKEGK